MPAYNVGKYIEQSLMSIKQQTFKNWELVIIDDCSDDNTHQNAVKYSDSKIRVFKRTSHCGRIGQVKNECISKLSEPHDYICHVGADDKIPPHCLEIFVKYLDGHPEIGACCGNFICFDDEGKQWSFPHVANSGEYDRNTLLQYMCLFPMRFYRRTVVDAVGGYSNELASAVDYDLALKIDETTKIKRIKDPITYHYRQHAKQVSTRARPEQDLNAKKALQAALKRRNINGEVIGDKPPFKIRYKDEEHFIWGKK